MVHTRMPNYSLNWIASSSAKQRLKKKVSIVQLAHSKLAQPNLISRFQTVYDGKSQQPTSTGKNPVYHHLSLHLLNSGWYLLVFLSADLFAVLFVWYTHFTTIIFFSSFAQITISGFNAQFQGTRVSLPGQSSFPILWLTDVKKTLLFSSDITHPLTKVIHWNSWALTWCFFLQGSSFATQLTPWTIPHNPEGKAYRIVHCPSQKG